MNHQLFSTIVDLVSHFTRVDQDEIFSRSRQKALVDSRYIIIYVARQLGIRLIYIQRFFALKGFDLHYTTLFHACKRVEKDIKEDDYFNNLIDNIILQLDPSKVLTPEDILKQIK